MITLVKDVCIDSYSSELEQAGIILDIIRFKIEATDSNDSNVGGVTLHQKAAVEFMREQQAKAAKWARLHASQTFQEEIFWQVEIYPNNPSAKAISWDELIGDKELNGFAHGLYSAFMDPPYGLQIQPEQADHQFEKLAQFLSPSFSLPIEIYTWDTNWANYFDAGKEWWGAYLWTVFSESGESITAIGASSTD